MPPERPDALKAFLTTIMRRTAVNRYNYNNRKKRVPSEMTVSLSEIEGCVSDGIGVSDEFNAEELGRLISAFVRALPDRRRYIFMSRYYVAQPIETIASELGVSRSTVNKEIAAIKADLKNLLEGEGFNV
jgi:RNA polymerase sigma-70 factor (ECF subfamily)